MAPPDLIPISNLWWMVKVKVTDGPTDKLRAAFKDKRPPRCQRLPHQAVIHLKTALTNYQVHKSGSFSQVWQGSSISCVILHVGRHKSKQERAVGSWLRRLLICHVNIKESTSCLNKNYLQPQFLNELRLPAWPQLKELMVCVGKNNESIKT